LYVTCYGNNWLICIFCSWTDKDISRRFNRFKYLAKWIWMDLDRSRRLICKKKWLRIFQDSRKKRCLEPSIFTYVSRQFKILEGVGFTEPFLILAVCWSWTDKDGSRRFGKFDMLVKFKYLDLDSSRFEWTVQDLGINSL
jgi:hypothetical protein